MSALINFTMGIGVASFAIVGVTIAAVVSFVLSERKR